MVLEQLLIVVTNAISFGGYAGVFLLMLLESALIPIPSEVIMPFSGYLAFTGRFGFWEVVLVGAFGNLIGSWIAYWLGMKGGRNLILKFHAGHGTKHLNLAERWFKKYGNITAFFSRLLPAVRTFISFPAGVGRMDIKQFSIYTFAGSFIWSAVLTYFGYLLGSRWEDIIIFFRQFEMAIFVIGVLIAIYWFKFRKK